MTQADLQNTSADVGAGATRKGRVSFVRVIILLVPALAVFLLILNQHIPHGHRPSPKHLCYINLRLMTEAKATWAFEHKKLPGDVPQDAELFGKGRFIVQKPVCPKGGTYTLGTVNEEPKCSIPGHTL